MSRDSNASSPKGPGSAPPLPESFGIVLDDDTVALDDLKLLGGSPSRVLRLSAAGGSALREIRRGSLSSLAARTLGRKLTDAGLAQPLPPTDAGALDLTIVVPVRDRAELLDLTLESLGSDYPILVVDDASRDPEQVAAVAKRHGARVVVRSVNGGPGVARSTGFAEVTTEFVAFVDSDCVSGEGWLSELAGHFEDPVVGAVTPRVVAAPRSTRSGRFSRACGPLDLGARSARVVPGSRVSYVPTAAMIARCSALADVTQGEDLFDPEMRVGEDVDLVWRLHYADWRVRYDASVPVEHHEPETWIGLLRRRFHYGTSTAPLSERHPGDVAPTVLYLWPNLVVGSILARRPLLALASLGGQLAVTHWALRRVDISFTRTLHSTITGIGTTWRGLGKSSVQFVSPVLAAALVVSGGATASRRWGRRAAVISLVLGPALAKYIEDRPDLDPVSFSVAYIADDIAYGSGVWFGCVKHRTLAPIKPRFHW